MKMSFSNNKEVLGELYDKLGLDNFLAKDCLYLENAFNEISKIWFENLKQIDKVNYLMIAEAPLWGKEKKYIYNPETNNSQFFYRSDLGDVLNTNITSKQDFIRVCNEIGLVIVDISPFPPNPNDTRINYRRNIYGSKKLTKRQYKELVHLTVPHYFEHKVKAIKEKLSKNAKTFIRYSRVKNTFQNIISDVLIDNNIIDSQNDIGDISQKGGGIHKIKLKHILSPTLP